VATARATFSTAMATWAGVPSSGSASAQPTSTAAIIPPATTASRRCPPAAAVYSASSGATQISPSGYPRPTEATVAAEVTSTTMAGRRRRATSATVATASSPQASQSSRRWPLPARAACTVTSTAKIPKPSTSARSAANGGRSHPDGRRARSTTVLTSAGVLTPAR
jgi:hypothetical protein